MPTITVHVVVDVAGAPPIEGADVRLFYTQTNEVMFTGTTDSSGNAVANFPIRINAGWLDCIVSKSGYTSERQSLVLPMEGDVYTIRLLAAEAPPTPGDYLAETYRGVEIWWIDAIGMYRAQVAAGYTAVGLTLPEIRGSIDEILAFLVPEAPPEGSIFTWIWDGIVGFIRALITPWTSAWDKFLGTTWPSWVTSFASLKAAWDQFYTSTLGSMMDSLRGLRATWDQFWTKTWPDYITSQAAKEFELRSYVETQKVELEVAVSEGDAATLERMRTDFPGWFAESMMTTMLAPFTFMFTFLSSKAMQGVVESFWRGLDEGLKE